MNRLRVFSILVVAAATFLLFQMTPPTMTGLAAIAAPNAGNQADSDKVLPADAQQLKELQKQIADLQARVSQLESLRIVAAGTATIKLPGIQDNKQKTRVKLPADIAARLGANCIVQLTNRCPTGGAFFVPYWKPATDGFDILVADPSLAGDYQIVPNDKAPYYIDWVVVQKTSVTAK
jgi:hypothetical protein